VTPAAGFSGLSPEDYQKIKLAIRNATSLDEASRLEKALSTGYIPDSNNESTTE